jgi:colanic acid/amylovoran biosynthesis glycosyltransferase
VIHYISIDGIGSAWVAIELSIMKRRGVPFVLHALRPPLNDLFSAQWALELNRRTRRLYPPSVLGIAWSLLLAPFVFGCRFYAAAVNSLFGQRETLRGRIAACAHFLIACDWARKLRREPVTMIHAQWAHAGATIGMYAAWLLGVPFSFTGHAADLFRDRVALKDKIRRANFIIAISNFHRRLYIQNGAREEQLHIVFCGIDVKQFPMRAAQRAIPPLRILSVGRLIEKKGFHLLIDACRLLQDHGTEFECVIAGSGPMEVELRRRIASLDLQDRVIITGKAVLQEALPQFLTEGDVFVQPCIWSRDNDVDGTPRTLMEAMACGLPCVSTRIVGIPDIIVDGQSGLLVAPDDPQELAEAIGRLLDDNNLARRLAIGGRERIEEHFNLDTCVEPLVELFASQLDKQGWSVPFISKPITG